MMKLKTLALLAVAAAPAVTLAAQDGKRTPERGQQEVERTWHTQIGVLAPDFELNTLDGRPWRLAANRGKVVVLEWFNPECPVVKAAHGEGGALATLGNRATKDGVVWVAINSGAQGKQGYGVEVNKAGKKRFGIEYPILLDESGWVGSMYEAKTTPHMFIIDPQGKLVYAGGHDDRAGTNLVEAALERVKAGQRPEEAETRNYGCGVKYAGKAAIGMVAPDFTLQDLDGREYRLSAFRGKRVVLEWFNPKCPVVTTAHTNGGPLEVCAANAQTDGVAWFSINSGGPGKQGAEVEVNRRAVQDWSMQNPILLDPTGRVGKAYGAKVTPQLFVIDERGVLRYEGAPREEGGPNLVERALSELKAGKKVTVEQTRSAGCSVKYAD